MALDPLVSHKILMERMTPKMRMQPGEDFTAWQERAREKLGEILGYPFEKGEQDNFHIEWTRTDDPRFDEIRFVFDSEEEATVPCHLLMPKNAPANLPLMICVQGHSTGMHISLGRAVYPGDENEATCGDRDFALQSVARGFATLAIEQRGFGERKGDSTARTNCQQICSQAILMGRTVVGERCFDVSCAIDIIKKYFPNIDTDRVALMGNSGGGETTLFAAAMDTRICAAMPSGVFSGLYDSIGAQLHCLCHYLPGLMKYFDMSELAALVAPRPLVVVNGETDPGFPVGGARREMERAKEYYRAAGAADQIAHVVGPEGHRFYADLSWPVFLKLLNWF